MPDHPSAIFMHIGHNKTGSSFLQSALASSAPELTANGLFYPISDHVAQMARNGSMTSGNLRSKPGAFTELVTQSRPAGVNRVLASGEGLFFYLYTDGPAFLKEIQTTCPGVPLHVLLYLRNPVDHAVSVYHQRVKRGGFTGTLADSLKTYDKPKKVRQVLTLLQQAQAQVTVLNYSNHRAALLGTMETWLDLPGGTLTAPAIQQVNRSLTLAELELQRAFNQQLGDAAKGFISAPLCNHLPEVKSETPALSTDDLRAFLRKMRRMTNDPMLEDLIPQAERFRVGAIGRHQARFPAPQPNPQFSFSAEQIKVLATAISTALSRKTP